MRPDGRRQRQAGREQERRPEHGVEAQDVLADEVDALGARVVPEPAVVRVVGRAEAEGGDVVGERVEPDVDDVARVPRKRDPPLHLRARDGEVVQPALHERDDLGEPALGPHELGVALVVLEQRRRVLRQAEEDVLLGLPHGRPCRGPGSASRRRAPSPCRRPRSSSSTSPRASRCRSRPAAAMRAIRASTPLPVPRLGRADEVVVANLERPVELPVALDDPVGELEGRDPLRRRGLLDVLAVLVGAGQEPRLFAREAAKARDHVRDDRRVDVPDVGQIVDVIDRSGRVERLHAEGERYLRRLRARSGRRCGCARNRGRG